ncbi:MAG: hypothetical protein A3C44_03440 [Gammaproteobacteria bacterium RIFCSPHIGHO2_02_FULL_39_13]|nr:MAG: hypothetical protein A3C44_03440 [Gammaproteobacteria bacterium RIFCSPHIGHO2_02_FULL_39_13]OGT48583.1 MAG: hypothetical protein A3E53_04330 [Gammaproteobacteria bacterium RIFCSPHIGHO2_12_FULL_39_24]
MNILIVTPLFPSHAKDHNGLFIVDSINSLKNAGYKITVLITRPWIPSILKMIRPNLHQSRDPFQLGYDIEILVTHYFSIPRNHMRWLSNWISFKQIGMKIKKIIKNYSIDLIHVHTELSVPPVVSVARQFDVPIIATMHGAETNKRYWRGVRKPIVKALPYVKKIVLVGEPLRIFFKKLVDNDNNFAVVPNGFLFSNNMLINNKQYWPDTLTFVSVSNLSDDAKRIDITLHAFAELEKEKQYNWSYIIIGEGTFKTEYEQLAFSLGLKDKVRFVGFCTHEEVYRYLLKSDIFCLPSFPEAFGVAHLEAMAFGLLAIGTRCQGPSIFIKHEETGLLVDKGSVFSLKSVLQMIFNNPEKMKKIALNGKKHVHENFTWEQHAKKLAAVYQEAR